MKRGRKRARREVTTTAATTSTTIAPPHPTPPTSLDDGLTKKTNQSKSLVEQLVLEHTRLLRDLCRLIITYWSSKMVITIGGFDCGHNLVDAWDCEKNQWISLPPLSRGRYGASYFFDERENIVLVGGRDRMSEAVETIECFDRQLQTWSDVTNRYTNLSNAMTEYSLLIRGSHDYFLFRWQPAPIMCRYNPKTDQFNSIGKDSSIMLSNLCNRGHQCMVYDSRRKRLWVLYRRDRDRWNYQFRVGFYDEASEIWQDPCATGDLRCPDNSIKFPNVYFSLFLLPGANELLVCGPVRSIWKVDLKTFQWTEWAKDALEYSDRGFYGGAALVDSSELILIDICRNVHIWKLDDPQHPQFFHGGKQNELLYHRALSTCVAI